MRLPESDIKSAILHRHQIVRDVALGYFANSFSKDPTIMPLVIQAVEQFGWDAAFEFHHPIERLAQTADTLAWVLDQLGRVAQPKNDDEEERQWHLSDCIAGADAALLARLDIPAIALRDEARQALTHRLELANVAPEECWKRLVEFCETNKDQPSIEEFDLPLTFRLAEGVARSHACANEVLAVLSQNLDDYANTAAEWLEPLAGRIAGQMRLGAAVPLLIAKLRDDSGDLMNEACEDAFVRIGTDEAVEAICRDFPAAPWHYRLYASGSLSHIHSDFVVRRCMELLEQEKDGSIRDNLAHAVIANFSPEGIEPARQITLGGSNEVRRTLVGVATLLGVDFPELAKWREVEEQQAARRKTDFASMTEGGLLEVMRKLAGKDAELPDDEVLDTPLLDDPIEPPAPIVRGKKIGRNEPCPCGSGKKYKKCCLGKD